MPTNDDYSNIVKAFVSLVEAFKSANIDPPVNIVLTHSSLSALEAMADSHLAFIGFGSRRQNGNSTIAGIQIETVESFDANTR